MTGSYASTIGQLNPFRYRGYLYDEESGLYYLNCRYYDPVTGRFLNADNLISTGQGVLSYNMFTYCQNNPVNLSDEMGNLPKWLKSVVKVAKVAARAYISLTCPVVGMAINTIALVKDVCKIRTVCKDQLRSSYTQEEAKTAISQASNGHINTISFNSDDDKPAVKITDSYKIISPQTIVETCMILSRTEGIERTTDSLIAEWVGHDVMFIYGAIKRNSDLMNHTGSVDLDYVRDERYYVVIDILEVFGF